MVKGGKWKDGQLKQTYEQIAQGQQALREGLAALGQGLVAVGQQVQANNAQMAQMAAANKAQMASFNASVKQQQNQYNKLYNEKMAELNNNPYSKNDPMNALNAQFYAKQQMAAQKSTGTSSKVVTGSNYVAQNIPSVQLSTPVNSYTPVAPVPVKEKINSGYTATNNNTNQAGTVQIKKYFKDHPQQLSEQYWAKTDNYGDVIEPHIIDGFYQSWHKNGKKEIECYYTDGGLDGQYTHWKETGLVDEFSTNATEDNSKASIDVYWEWKNGNLNQIVLRNLRPQDESYSSREIFTIDYFPAKNVYQYTDKLRNLEYIASPYLITDYRDDEIEYHQYSRSGYKTFDFYYKGKQVCKIQYYQNGKLQFIAPNYIYGSYPPAEEYDWGSITYDESGKESRYISDEGKYNNAMRLKEMIKNVSEKNASDITSIVNQYRSMMDPNRYK